MATGTAVKTKHSNASERAASNGRLFEEIGRLAEAAKAGQLSERATVELFEGTERQLAEGVNEMLDAVIGPLNVAAEYVESISKGVIPEKITDEYKGDFNEIKNNLNAAIEVMNGLLAETNQLIQATQDGQLQTRGDASKFAGGWGELVGGVNNLIEAFVRPINVTAEYVDAISKGEIPEKITDEYKGDFNEIKNNLNAAIEVMNGLLAETNQLIQATQDGQLQTRGDASKFAGGWGELVGGVNNLIEAFVMPINVTAEYVDAISKGEIPEKITDEYKGDFNEIKNNLNAAIEVMNGLLAETNQLIQATQDGQLQTRGDASKFAGGWGELVGGVNNLIEAFVRPINVTAEYVDAISKGEIPEKITDEYKGDFNEIKNNLNAAIEVMNGLLAETNRLIQASQDGQLQTRGDASKFAGGWGELVGGVNNLIEAFVRPINVTAEYVDAISKGEIPEKITDEYKGDFNEIKNNLNACIDAVTELVTAADTLAEAAVAGQLATRADASKHQGDFQKIVQGVNQTLDAVLEPINEAAGVLEKLAQRDLTARVTGEYQGDHAKIKDSLNTATQALCDALLAVGRNTQQVSESSGQVAKGAEDTGKASQQIAETIQQVAKGANEQTETVTNTAKSMEQLNGAVEEVAKGAQSQAETAQATNKQMNEISQAIEQVAQNAQNAAEGAQQVAETAKAGGEAVQSTVEGMGKVAAASDESGANVRSLGESSKQIGEIVDTITDIAEQTNLLALNAAIEAARAGEHGKGFAVVADEVRKLAERSANATKEIGNLIKGIQAGVEDAVTSMEQVAKEVEQGTALSQQAGKSLEQILGAVDGVVGQAQDVSAAAQQMSAGAAEVLKSVENISAVTEESTAAAQQMSANSGEVTKAVEQISAISEENAAAAEEVSAAAQEQNASVEEMSASAQEMAKLAGELEELVGQFKTENGQAGEALVASHK